MTALTASARSSARFTTLANGDRRGALTFTSGTPSTPSEALFTPSTSNSLGTTSIRTSPRTSSERTKRLGDALVPLGGEGDDDAIHVEGRDERGELRRGSRYGSGTSGSAGGAEPVDEAEDLDVVAARQLLATSRRPAGAHDDRALEG